MYFTCLHVHVHAHVHVHVVVFGTASALKCEVPHAAADAGGRRELVAGLKSEISQRVGAGLA